MRPAPPSAGTPAGPDGRARLALRIAALAWMGVIAGQVATGQEQAQQAEARTTRGGVYTADQASRGESTFGSLCTGCHTLADFSTPAFAKKWNGMPVADFFALISETMPEDFPGSLKPEEYAQVIAYVLRVNRMPAGQTALPVDREALRQIRFEFSDD